MNRLKFLIIYISSAILLVGCGSPIETAKKIGKVIIDPSIPVGEKAVQPSTIRFSLLADADINPNFSGDATPLQVTVVYLREDSKLLNLALDELTDVDIETVLGKNYLDHQDYTLIPGQFKTLEEIKLYKENQYVAVIGYYAADAESEWKRIIPAKGKGEEYKFLIHARKSAIDIRQDGDNPIDLEEFKVEESQQELYSSEEALADEESINGETTIDLEQSEELTDGTGFELTTQEVIEPYTGGNQLSYDLTKTATSSESLAINGVTTGEASQVPYPFLAGQRALITPVKEPINSNINSTNELMKENENIKAVILNALAPKAPVTRITLESTQPMTSQNFINVRAPNKVVIIESLNQSVKKTNSN